MELALAGGSPGCWDDRGEALLERFYRRRFTPLTSLAPAPSPADAMNTTVERVGMPSRPLWTTSVLSRISRSIVPAGESESAPQRQWLSTEVAAAGCRFFDSYASLLPSEPHIYASEDGDLVAEFSGSAGRLTAVIGSPDLILFVSGEKRLHWSKDESTEPEMNALSRFVGMINPVSHGLVDPAK